MNPDSVRGACPACGQRISALQAVWYGARRPFSCRRCGVRLEKTSARLLIIVPLVAVAAYVARLEGIASPATWTVIGIACVLVVADALYVGKVRRSGRG